MGEPVSTKYKLSYFDMKGLAEPLRMMFHVKEIPFEDNRIQRQNWPKLKETFRYGQLPVLEVGDKSISQSNAIARFLARRFGLYGSNEFEEAKIDEYADVVVDFRSEWRKFFIEKDPAKKEELKKNLVEKVLPASLGKIDAEMTDKFLVGGQLSWVDLQMAHCIELFEGICGADALDKYSNLKQLQKTVFDIPQIQAWIQARPNTEF